MKRNLLCKILLAAGVLIGAQAQAAYMPDTLLCKKDLGNSGQGTETAEMQACVDSVFGLGAYTIVFDEKFDQGGPGFNVTADGPNQWFIDVAPDEPGFFSLKFGIGGISATNNTYFFQNIAELTKLVFTDTQVDFITGGSSCTNCNIGRLSHYSLYNGGGEVPEPGTLALLGAGLVGLSLIRRRRRA